MTEATCPFFQFIKEHQTDDYKYYLTNHDISIGIRPEQIVPVHEIARFTFGCGTGTYNLPQTEKITQR